VLTIRNEQLRVLGAQRRTDFEVRLARHLLRFFPAKIGSLSPDDLEVFIRHGSSRAQRYGLDTERDICKYLSLMCVFGRDFDSDARQPWAGEILRRPFRTSRSKMNRLMEVALQRAGSV
jgi:hypothetical protein